MQKPTLHQCTGTLLCFNGGYVDAAGFLALDGLFTGHVTGKLVNISVALVDDGEGTVSKLLAFPVFCVVVVGLRFLCRRIGGNSASIVRTLLLMEAGLLLAACAMALAWAPLADGDDWRAILTGMTLVAAMATQTVVCRIGLVEEAPTTVVTLTVTQIMMDLPDLLSRTPAANHTAARARLLRLAPVVSIFVLGCVSAAVLFVAVGLWCFAVPPVMALLASWSFSEEPRQHRPHALIR
ncbi:DUF1275 family protein [Bordetella sp. LUAb4]|uniref:DUF1275 family protein n=1 Tax=Bordetella sp. LUAb4 TaxID=2843195 RepID=UPI001E47BB91|nr:DUF1275 family protein [Bordetella sp. LUAb4]